MKVNSYNIEFGYELLGVVPYAYEKYLSGELTETESGVGSEALYYFSPKHTINYEQRSWFNTDKAKKEIPYLNIHVPERPNLKYPDYKSHYANDQYKWYKPTLCICNRYNIEWSTRAINYFDTKILNWLFSNLKDKYEIIYFPVSIPSNIQDNEAPIKMNDLAVAKRHGVKVFTDLLGDWNETMMKVFANCDHYITMNGGYSIMASLFSGTNIVYSVPGNPEARELKNKSFWRWYSNINNVRTLHIPSYDDLKAKVKALYIDDNPCVNILIRTHRPGYLSQCMKSITSQTYPNINVVFICDSEKGVKGTRKHNGRLINAPKVIKNEKPKGDQYGKYFPYNEYLDYAQKHIKGFIVILDDDDMFTCDDAVETIVKSASANSLVIWKSDFKDMGIIPREFGKITMCDIGGICFCYHTDHIDKTDWSQWKRADYRTAKKLSESLNTVWVDKILTGIQDRLGMGVKPDLAEQPKQYKLTHANGKEIVQSFSDKEIEEFTDIFKRQNICIELMK